MTVLIPAYEPDGRLPALVRALQDAQLRVVVVDDGSGARYADIFEQVRACGASVLTHRSNLGKGCALKTGFSYILEHGQESEGVVTADADGQHRPADILRVADALRGSQGRVVLGVRRFAGRVPLRSAVGNLAMRVLFALASGKAVQDTQTGLRGIPSGLLPHLSRVRGARFEYEINMLLDLANAGCAFTQVEIDTVYAPGNDSSHFRPLIDSVRVLLPTLRFCVSSIAAAATDYTLLFVFQWLTHSLFLGVLFARVASSAVQYTVSRSVVFHSRLSAQKQPNRVWRYYMVVAGLFLCNYLLLRLFTGYFHMWLLAAKLVTEFVLFFLGYAAQRFLVFRRPVTRRVG